MGQPILHEQTQAELHRQNAADGNFNAKINGHMMREPKRMIYIHTVSKKPQTVTRTLFAKLHLKGIQGDERYTTCAVIPDPIAQPSPDQERGGSRIDEHDGWRACIDLLNPNNWTTDPYTGANNPDFYANRQGSNLIAEGFWPSLNEVPTEKEILRAEDSVKKHWQWLTKEAIRMSGSGMQREFNEFLQNYPDVHIAMDGLGLSAPWHTASVVEAFCPNCGEKIRPGIAFHRDAENTLCIIDTLKTFKAGKITKEQYEMLTEDKAPEPKAKNIRG